MSISRETWKRMKVKFGTVWETGHCASWAVWKGWGNKTDLGTDVFFDEEALLPQLNDKYVFVGLNPSGTEQNNRDRWSPWSNFHSITPTSHDDALAYALQNTRYWGSYLTDFFKDQFTGNSGELDWSETKIENAVRELKEELDCLGNVEQIFMLGKKATYRKKAKELKRVWNRLMACFSNLRPPICLTHYTYATYSPKEEREKNGWSKEEWYRNKIQAEIESPEELFL